MEKLRFLEYCKQAGLPVIIKDNVVFLNTETEKADVQIEEFLSMIASSGYHESYGWSGGMPRVPVSDDEETA